MFGGGYTQHPGEGVLYAPSEFLQARRRPGPDRPRIPQVDDELFYRHNGGSPHVYRIQVTWVQSLEDMEDSNLWYFQSNPDGSPLMLDGGSMVLARAHDPWPLLRAVLMEPTNDHGRNVDLAAGWPIETREARMRGSAGWLPLDWQSRPQPQVPNIVVAG